MTAESSCKMVQSMRLYHFYNIWVKAFAIHIKVEIRGFLWYNESVKANFG